MASARDLANLRRAAAATKRDLARFRRAVATVEARAVQAAHVAGKRAHKAMYDRYGAGQYANKAGNVTNIKPFGKAWATRKARLNLDPRPGVARKGILKQIRSPLGFAKAPKGFVIDLKAPALTITGRATVGRSRRAIAVAKGTSRAAGVTGVKFSLTNRRSFFVNDYIDHFTDDKAPGLGSLADDDRAAVGAAVRDALQKHLSGVQPQGLSIARRAAATLNVRFA